MNGKDSPRVAGPPGKKKGSASNPAGRVGAPEATTRKIDLAAKLEATQLLGQGLAYLREARFAEALERFEKAYALVPSAKLLLNIGTSLRQLNRPSQAAEAYERYLAHPEAAPDRVREVERILEAIDREVAWIELVPAPREARVTVDGEPVVPRRGALRVRLDPGTHVVVAEATGAWLQKVVSLELKAGERRTVRFALEPKPAPGDGGATQRTVGFSVGGVGLAALGAGAVLGALAAKSDTLAVEHCSTPTLCDAQGSSLGARANREALGSTIAFAVGGAAATAGLVLVFTAPSSLATSAAPPASGRGGAPAQGASLEARVSPAGASLRWRW
jgi:hypothetical protein